MPDRIDKYSHIYYVAAAVNKRIYGFLFSVPITERHFRLVGNREQEFTGSSSLCRNLGSAEAFVPSVDFRAVRELISIAEVLELVGF